jgi:hypothetical protein
MTTTATIQTETAKMIYADIKIANMLKGKMAKRNPDKTWEVAKVATGYQVREVPPVLEAPKPVTKVVVKSAHGQTVTVIVPFAKETVRWIDFKEPVGPKGVKFFHKAHVIDSKLEDGMLTMVVNRKAAIEKGLIAEDAA